MANVPACWRLQSTFNGLSDFQLTAAVLLRLEGLLLVKSSADCLFLCQVRNSESQEGGVCKVGLRLKSYPDNPIQCVASACQFKDGSGKIQCKNAQCACQQGACPGEQSGQPLCTAKEDTRYICAMAVQKQRRLLLFLKLKGCTTQCTD